MPAPKPADEPTKAPIEPAPAQPVTIEWWWGWTPDLIVNTLNEVAAEFTAANPSIQVKTGQHEWGEKLLTAYAAGTPPDIHEHWLPLEFAARGLLLPIDDFAAASKIVSHDLFPEVSWSVGAWNGKHYTLPALAFFAELALVANPVVFTDAGLNVPDDIPTTLDDAFEQTKKYSRTDTAGNLEVVWLTPDKGLRYMPTQFGIKAYDPEQHKWRFDDPAFEDMVISIARFYQELGPEKLDAFNQAYPGWIAVPGSAFASDRLAMVTSGYWIPGELDKNAPGKEFIYTWAPTGGAAKGKKVTHWGAHSVMIPKQTKHPNEAWALAEFFATVGSAQIIFEGCGWIAPQKTFWDVMDVNRYRGLDFFVNDLARNAEVQTVNPASPALAFALGAFGTDVTDAVIYANKTPKQALADFQVAVMEQEARLSGGS
jgi:multiple sugar transport system substrate-binding protein